MIEINKTQHAKIHAGRSVRLQANKITQAKIDLVEVVKVGQIMRVELSTPTGSIQTPVEVVSVSNNDFKIVHANK